MCDIDSTLDLCYQEQEENELLDNDESDEIEQEENQDTD